ncbi:hypothetical protein, partial [Pseudomonas aeruginosa]|uniref:hypothetical protein n=1 Tax=Pseudomonas aeruginosa TaxID=287 RepID=UPI0033651459
VSLYMFQRKARNPSFSKTFKEDPIPAYKNCNVMASPPTPMSEVKQVCIGISHEVRTIQDICDLQNHSILVISQAPTKASDV